MQQLFPPVVGDVLRNHNGDDIAGITAAQPADIAENRPTEFPVGGLDDRQRNVEVVAFPLLAKTPGLGFVDGDRQCGELVGVGEFCVTEGEHGGLVQLGHQDDGMVAARLDHSGVLGHRHHVPDSAVVDADRLHQGVEHRHRDDREVSAAGELVPDDDYQDTSCGHCPEEVDQL